jgi:hypothetical protein
MADAGGRGADLLHVVGAVLAQATRAGAAKADVLAAGIAERAGVTVDAGRVVAASALALGLGGVGLAVNTAGAAWAATAFRRGDELWRGRCAQRRVAPSLRLHAHSIPIPPSLHICQPQVRSLLGNGTGGGAAAGSGLIEVDAALVPLLLPTGMLSVAAPGGVDAAKLAAAGAAAHRTLLRQVAFLLEHSPDAFRALPLSVLQGCVRPPPGWRWRQAERETVAALRGTVRARSLTLCHPSLTLTRSPHPPAARCPRHRWRRPPCSRSPPTLDARAARYMRASR